MLLNCGSIARITLESLSTLLYGLESKCRVMGHVTYVLIVYLFVFVGIMSSYPC